ncbi:MAG: organic solvent tolerance protein OstA [Treponema sp.]|nr:organic solvent tolerance protein OstA [Treponema sp.]
MKKNTLTLLCAAFLCLTPLFAERIVFQADSMTGNTGKKNEYTKLSGSASVVTETMEISADTIELSGKDFRFITASGGVTGKIKDSQMDFTCGTMTYDREKKTAVLKNTVHLVDVQNNVTADAEIIDYNQNTEIAVMQINVNLVQKENTCTAANAVYQKNEKMLLLTGNPTVQQGSDLFRAQEISLNLDTNEITLDGRVRGSVSADSKSGDSKSNDSKSTDSKAAEKKKEKQ